MDTVPIQVIIDLLDDLNDAMTSIEKWVRSRVTAIVLGCMIYHALHSISRDRKGGDKVIRTVVVTTVKNKNTGERKELYGRYDIVAMYNQDYEVVSQEKRQYEMSDADFVANATFKQIVRSGIKED